MIDSPTVALPSVADIDLSFRPRSYFWPLTLETHLQTRVRGAARRAALQRLIDARRLAEAPAFLVLSTLSESERSAIGRTHPALMGGEFLRDLIQDEVEIARITIASVTQDVTCVLALRRRRRIYHPVVTNMPVTPSAAARSVSLPSR